MNNKKERKERKEGRKEGRKGRKRKKEKERSVGSEILIKERNKGNQILRSIIN